MTVINEEAPSTQTHRSVTPAVAVKGATTKTIIAAAGFKGLIQSVSYIPTALVTGAATNFCTLKVLRKGPKGETSTVVAELEYKESAVTAKPFVNNAIPLSGTAANLELAEGEVLELEQVVTGEGIALPAGQIAVTIAREEVTAEQPETGAVKQPVAANEGE